MCKRGRKIFRPYSSGINLPASLGSNLRLALIYSIKLGKNAFEGKPEELKKNKEKLKELFL